MVVQKQRKQKRRQLKNPEPSLLFRVETARRREKAAVHFGPISYAPEGAEVTDAVKNVQVVVAARSSPYASIGADLMAKRLSKDFIIYCSACHDDYGNGVIGPSLLGKNAKELREMIDKYSREPDANVLMTDLVHRLSEEKIQFIAGDIARFNAELAAEAKKGRQNDWLKELLKSEENVR